MMPRGNYFFMLAGLLFLLLLAPVISNVFPITSPFIIQVAFILVMVLGVWSLNINTRWFMAGLVLAVSTIILTMINVYTGSTTVYLTSLFFILVFCIMSAILIMKNIFFTGRITTNKIIGSVCIYLLIGVIWAIMYDLIAHFEPGAFRGLSLDKEQAWDYAYYSFVTLTTLGYGDIAPITPIARSFAYLEAICGQFYLAILVASLVGAYLKEHKTTEKNTSDEL